MLTVDELRASFNYDPETGIITRKTDQGNYKAGSVCTGKFVDGYGKVTYRGVQMKQHRLAWILHKGEYPPEQIDHVNLDKSDNRWVNLRAANSSTNQQNIVAHKRSTLGIKGIFPVRGGTLFRAEVCINGRRIQKHNKSVEFLKQWVVETREKYHVYANHG